VSPVTAAMRLIEQALDPSVAPPDDAASERILDAALEVAAASGMRGVTMDEVARRAGVGRMTVYRRFGDRGRLVDALTVREARRCVAQIDGAIDFDLPLEDGIVEGFVAAMRVAREHPLLNRLARFEPAAVLASLSADGGMVFALLRGAVAARLREVGVGDADPDHLAELLVRICVSFVLVQDGGAVPVGDDDSARAAARELIAPMVLGAAGV
jgi:AcrR family transcriptional regulator